LVTPYKLSPTP